MHVAEIWSQEWFFGTPVRAPTPPPQLPGIVDPFLWGKGAFSSASPPRCPVQVGKFLVPKKKKKEVSPSHRPGAPFSCWEGFLFLTVVFVPRKLPWGVDKMGRLRSGAKRFLKVPLFDVYENLAPQEGTLQVRLGGTVRFDSCSVSV